MTPVLDRVGIVEGIMLDTKQREAALEALIPLLRQHSALSSRTGEHIAELASSAETKFVARDEVLTRQGDIDGRFFVVIEGQLRSCDTQASPPRLLNLHPPGEIVGTRALSAEGIKPRAATVEAETDSIVAVYDKAQWDRLVVMQPGVLDYFRGLERHFEQRSGIDFLGRQPDEVVVAYAKRHVIAFIANLVWPLFLLIIALLVVLGDEFFGVTFLSAFTANLWLTVIGIIIPALLGILLAVYHYLDWRNDDFIVTSKRVIHIERVLLFRMERHEAPLTRIQNVTVKSHGWLDEVVGSRDIEIKTAGAGVIAFAELPRAHDFSEIILQEQARAKARSSAADVASLRRLMGERLKTGPRATTTPPPGRAGVKRLVPVFPRFSFDYFLPRIKEQRTMKTGEKTETAIVWRKHYFVLLGKIILPLLAIVATFYLTVAALFSIPILGAALGPVAGLLSFLALLLSFLWYLWQYDGWRRDIYIVTESRIIDVESSPFRVRGEQQREGNFDSIQNIYYKIPNFFNTLINLGDVIIETAAGVGKNFTFVKVYGPSLVHEEVFERWDEYQRKREEKRRDDTNKQIVTALGEYHDGTY